MNAELQSELNIVIRAMQGLSPAAQKHSKQILTEAARPLVSAIQGRTPVSDKPHKRYSSTGGANRAPKGAGKVVATYYPGNLKRSFNVLRFRKSKAVFVGPRVSGTTGDFRGRRADGYYAHMVEFGTKYARKQPFVAAAVNAAGDTVLRIAVTLFRREILTYAKMNGL